MMALHRLTTTRVLIGRPEAPIADVVMRISELGLLHRPVIGPDERHVDIRSRTDATAAFGDAAGTQDHAVPARLALPA
ncbi:hypothetical protein [Methylobacterium segetis]|uniref:hypothetical protein n=1 Tax=Methylobacterium segetis TaxID=2488750 RepID=UPI00104C9344|nr:hypothetical protein [Methylobacterium segetis]